jgi:putative addiction module killer protein
MLVPKVQSYERADGARPFDESFERLRDVRAATRIDTAILKLERGLRPGLRPVGDGVLEARIDYGPGYRVYFGADGTDLIVLLLCGDKRTQADDIAFAKVLWAEYRARKAALPAVLQPRRR